MNYEYALERAIGHLYNNYKKDENISEFAVVVFDIFRYAENKEELIIKTLHDYGVGTKILNNKWCDLTDVIQLCYPEYNWEDVPKNFDELLEWQQKNNIVEWDHEFDDIDYYIDPKQINGYPYFVLVGTSENNLRILEIPDDKVDLMKQFVMDNNFTDLLFKMKENKGKKR